MRQCFPCQSFPGPRFPRSRVPDAADGDCGRFHWKDPWMTGPKFSESSQHHPMTGPTVTIDAGYHSDFLKGMQTTEMMMLSVLPPELLCLSSFNLKAAASNSGVIVLAELTGDGVVVVVVDVVLECRWDVLLLVVVGSLVVMIDEYVGEGVVLVTSVSPSFSTTSITSGASVVDVLTFFLRILRLLDPLAPLSSSFFGLFLHATFDG